MADPNLQDANNPAVWGGVGVAVSAFFMWLRSFFNRDKAEAAAATRSAAYDKAAQDIVERLSAEVGELRERIEVAVGERDECLRRYQLLETVLVSLAHRVSKVEGFGDVERLVREGLKTGDLGSVEEQLL